MSAKSQCIIRGVDPGGDWGLDPLKICRRVRVLTPQCHILSFKTVDSHRLKLFRCRKTGLGFLRLFLASVNRRSRNVATVCGNCSNRNSIPNTVEIQLINMWCIAAAAAAAAVSHWFTDLHLANPGSTPAATHISHWWRQDGHPAKIAPCTRKSYLYW